MTEQHLTQKNADTGVLYAPWEKQLAKVLTPFEEFVRRETTSGLLLMGAAILALLLANSTLAGAYSHLVHLPIGIRVGGLALEKSLHHWVNDGLMALFFFVVGMELKREMLVGELADLRQAVLPIVAAIGGIAMPALIYLGFNAAHGTMRGWGVPMATDIAFAVGVLAPLGGRAPKGLVTFLVALAIVDDLGAVLVIALFYTRQLAFGWLAVAGVLLVVLIVFNLGGIRKITPYFAVAVLIWYALLQSGVHATLAGVLGAFTVPARSKFDPAFFSGRARTLIARFEAQHQPGATVMASDELHGALQALEDSVVAAHTPLQRLEHMWHVPVAILVIPVFALANAGIPLNFASLADAFLHPVTQGVAIGLVLGKFLGICGTSWLAVRLGIARLPAGTRFSQIAGVSLLGGIGFTMSIFIAELGFSTQPEDLLMAKTGILAASIVSGTAGFAWLWAAGRRDA